MRVLFLSVAGRLGGAERVLVDSLAALRRVAPGVEPALISAEDGPVVTTARALGVPADVVPLPDGLASLGESGSSSVGTIAATLAAAAPLRRYRRLLSAAIAAHQPALIHSNGLKMHLLSVSLRARVPVLWHMHDYPASRATSARLLGWAAPRAAGAIAPSHSVAADTSRLLGDAFPVTTVHNAVDLERFTPLGPALDLDAAAGLPPTVPGAVRIGLVATYARWKGHHVFLDALASLDRSTAWRGYVIGGPLYRTPGSQITADELRRRTNALGIHDRVGFVGFLPDTSPALRALDIVVHASTSPEPFGLTVAEGMASGRPVAVSAIGGVTELFTDEVDALGFPAGDARALGAVLGRLAAQPARRARIGAAARASAERQFSLERLGTELAACYGLAASPALARRPAC